jgi:hypothetical protein
MHGVDQQVELLLNTTTSGFSGQLSRFTGFLTDWCLNWLKSRCKDTRVNTKNGYNEGSQLSMPN